MRCVRRIAALALSCVLFTACTSAEPPASTPTPTSTDSSSSPAPSATPTPSSTPTPPPDPVSIAALQATPHRGSRLRLGAVRERTSAYTSYDVTYLVASGRRDLTISGVLNVPSGPGPFPAVVLAHGYIDPAYYVRGQGMTRERGVFASRGYVALHVDYRGHAESTDDPRSGPGPAPRLLR